MLAMARVMIGAPRLVLIDEPSEGLAPMIVADIFDIISEMKAAGMIVLLVEQNLSGALAVSDRFYAIERGAVIIAGQTREENARQDLMKAIAV
jgi:branched-chain amino acid transport system ATP-binding protein